MICEKAEVPVQMYFNRSDVLGGSTLGNISNTQVALNTVDIGVAQLAMHSPYETAGMKDVTYLTKMAETFFGSSIHMTDDGAIELRQKQSVEKEKEFRFERDWTLSLLIL